MLTLSQATSESRTTIKIILIIIGGLLSLIIIFRILFALKNTFFPTPPPPPTVAFGSLPQIKFPQSATEKKLKYTIDTVPGTLPTFPDRAYVNRMGSYSRNILEVDDANSRVSNVGFPVPGVKLSDIIYRWTDNTTIKREITMNVVTKDFILTSLFISDPTSVSGANLSSPYQARQVASDFMSDMNEVPSDIDDSATSTVSYAVDNQALIAATSLSNTQIVGVYFFQKDIHNLPIMYPKAKTSTMSFLVGSGQYEPQIVGANFSHQYILDESATYPIITAQEAYDDLLAGKAYVSSYFSGESIMIKHVFMGYYSGEEKQPYLMPVIVFEGDNGFYAYVSAVKGEWIKN